MRRTLSILFCLIFFTTQASAQLSQNPDKFLGNITTRYQVDAGGGVPAYYTLWNQITPENESKWGSVEGTRGQYNWGSDTPFNYAKSHNFTYKFHALVWGAQYPNWFSSSLSVDERYKAIVKWFDEVKKHYPDLPMIDVVNEAVGMHQQGNPLMKESLGGGGNTGYDWLIKAFELAYERWPNATLIYNDYNTFQHDTDAYIQLVKTLRDAGAPIDAYGCQSHDVDNISKSDLQNAMAKIQNAVKIPMFITELDINVEDNNQQKNQYQSIFPVMWEASYCAGVTIWGYVYGATWVDHSGLYRDGVERPAMTWLKEYMATDKAKTAKSPLPGGRKEISLYVKPATLQATKNDTLPITIRAKMVGDDKKIDSIKVYVNNRLVKTLKEEPFVVKYVPKNAGSYSIKAVAYSNGKSYERLSDFTAHEPRKPYADISLPGIIEAEDYDVCGEGITYHDSESQNQGDASYRTSDGVDIVKGNGGRAIGYTSTDEWLEYTVNVTKAGYYSYQAVASSGTTGSGFRLSVKDGNSYTNITDKISVPQTGSNSWSNYTTILGRTTVQLKEGKQIIRLTITGSNCNIDKITFKHVEVSRNMNIRIKANPTEAAVNANTTLTFTTVSSKYQDSIAKVKVYFDGKIAATLSKKPFQYSFKPTSKGTITVSAYAIDSLGRESAQISKLSLKVTGQRSVYKSMELPGTVEAENFDKGGEGLSFHDSDSNDEGKASYRTDNNGVDIIKIGDNKQYAIGYSKIDEWLEYTVNVKSSGTYDYVAYVSAASDNATFRIGLMKEDGREIELSNVSVPNEGSLDNYTTVSGTLDKGLGTGPHIIRITFTGAQCNIDKIEFTFKSNVNYITTDDLNANGTRYNLAGQRVNEYNNHGITIINGKKVLILE